MVKGLSLGIYNPVNESSPEVPMSSIKHSKSNLSVVIDGISLAYLIVTNKDPDHGWEYANGGDYKLYAKRMIDFFKVLKSANVESLIVFPLPDGTGPVTDALVTKWKNSAMETIRRINRTRQFIEKDYQAKKLLEVLPPFIITLIVETANKLRIPVVYTRNNIVRFLARFVAAGEADAVLGQDTDYVLFKGIKYIPIDSIYHNAEGVLCCDYLDSTFVAESIGLENEDYLFDLSCILGNACTELLMEKYNAYVILHCKPDPETPTLLIDTAVEFLNKDTYKGLDKTTPFKEIMEDDPEFKKCVEEALEFYDITGEFPPEGDDYIREDVEKGILPMWSVAISEGNDFYIDPIVDDYRDEITTANITRPYRLIMYGLLERDSVREHIPTENVIIEKEFRTSDDIPPLAEIREMDKDQLSMAFYKIAHQNFPKPPKIESDPLAFFEEPAKTVGFALRYIVAQCFTENHNQYQCTPHDNNEFRDAKILGAPPIDYFELRALAAQALILMMINVDTFKAPEFKPKLRRVHCGALYQSVMQHMIWLQMFFDQKNYKVSPHNFYNGQIFAAAYNAKGMIGTDEFANYFSEPQKIKILEEKRLNPFLKAILYPFPSTLFKVFELAPRSIPTPVYDQYKANIKKNKPIAVVVEAHEEEDEGDSKKGKGKGKAKNKKDSSEDDEEQLAFLMSIASTKEPKKVIAAAPVKKNKGPPKRRVEKVDFNQIKQEYEKENKLTAKMQKRTPKFKMDVD